MSMMQRFFEMAETETRNTVELLKRIEAIELVICDPTARKEYNAEQMTNLKLEYAELIRQAKSMGLVKSIEFRTK